MTHDCLIDYSNVDVVVVVLVHRDLPINVNTKYYATQIKDCFKSGWW